MDTFLHSTTFILILLGINLLLLVLYIFNMVNLSKLRRSYNDFMKKLGKGENIDEMLQEYVQMVERVNIENKDIQKYCKEIDLKAQNNLSKIGLVRYNAFKDTGSNLSFALAVLNTDNNGVVLNGIYSRDTSNIYCKTVVQGKSEYALSKEEEEAIAQAVNKK